VVAAQHHHSRSPFVGAGCFSDLYPAETPHSDPARFERSNLSRTIEHTYRHGNQGCADTKRATIRRLSTSPRRRQRIRCDAQPRLALLVWTSYAETVAGVVPLAQWMMGAVCSTEGDHISDCGSVSWFDKDCHRIGTSWRDNVKHFCRVGTSDLNFTLPPGQSTTSMDGTNGTNGTNGTQVGGGSTLTQTMMSNLMQDMMHDMTTASGEWVERICTTCEYYRARMAREQSNATVVKCSCTGFQAHSDGFEGVSVNGSNVINGRNFLPPMICVDYTSCIQWTDWLPFTKVCDSPNVPEHIWWYAKND
jgi:hypothetical protein